MKKYIIILLILTFICNQIYADKQFTSDQIKEFTDLENLKKFSKSGFGGGKLINLKNSLYDIYIADIDNASGVYSSSAYVYKKQLNKYILIKTLPYINSKYRRYELKSSEIHVFQVANNDPKDKLETRIQLIKP